MDKLQEKVELTDKLSIVVITHNRAADLARTLKNLTELPEKASIIVVDNASTDRTEVMVESLFPEVTYIKLEDNLYAIARNLGVEAAKTPFIAFSDDDSWWEAGSLLRAIDILENYPDVGAVAAKILVNEEKKQDPLNEYFRTSPLPKFVSMPGPSLMGFLECAVVMRKKAFEEAGGYNENLAFAGEGALLAADMVSLGWGITYDPEVVTFHFPSSIRNMPKRHRMGARTVIWRAWLKRPVKSAIKETLEQMRLGVKNPYLLLGVLDSLKGIPMIIREREVVPEHIEHYFMLLKRQDEWIRNKKTKKRASYKEQLDFS